MQPFDTKAAEKIHSRLDFPEVMYMDRYMKANKAVTRAKREEVRALKERRAALKAKLSQFSTYSTDGVAASTNISLPDALQLTMDFATGGGTASTPQQA